MKVIEENNIVFSLAVRDITVHSVTPGAQIGSMPGEEIVLKGLGTLYIAGDEIYLGRKGKWFRINVGDIEVVNDYNTNKISVVLSFSVPGKRRIEIVLESDKYSHLRALKHILNIYNIYIHGGGPHVG